MRWSCPGTLASHAARVSPPKSVSTSPVIKLESALLAKNTNAGATSSGCPGRFMGVSAPCLATFSAGLDAGCSGVHMGPGETQLTLMPRSMRFCARDFVKAWIAPFVEA